jgi:co-chaperonin GroES (HSP10)
MNDISNLKFLGDIIVVEHLEKNIQSSTLIIPETTRDWVAPVKAKVLAIGKLVKPRKDYLRDRKKRGCTNKTFACDYISIGDIVLVPVELGTRGRISGNDDAIIMDSEDIIALVEDVPGEMKEHRYEEVIQPKIIIPSLQNFVMKTQLCDDLPGSY